MRRPIGNGRNGRDRQGRFAVGNPGGPGNPYTQRTAEIRAAMMDAVSDDDLRAIIRALVKKAKRGDVPAARELLDRVIGKSHQSIDFTGEQTVNVQEEATAAQIAHIDAMLAELHAESEEQSGAEQAAEDARERGATDAGSDIAGRTP